jgi:S1-C subfamily serine protease
VQVEDFVDDAPAAKSGVEKGDILLQVGDLPIKTPDDVLNAAFYLTAGDDAPIKVLRNGEKLDFEIKPGAHPTTPHHTASIPAPAPGMPAPLKPVQ